MDCYRLSFQGPFHVDGRGVGFYEASEPFIRSDTLSAALLSAWALLDPSEAGQRAAEPPFRVSSCFPYWRHNLFLPRPVASIALRLTEERLSENKALKKIQWLTPELWKQAAIAAEDWKPPVTTGSAAKMTVWQGVLALPVEQAVGLPERLWAEEERPRLAVERTSNSPADGALFHFGRIFFQSGGGLYFLARFDKPAQRERFEAALSLLGDQGLGADRTSGGGSFIWTHGTAPVLPSLSDGPAIALSLVNPAPEDCHGEWLQDAKYNLINRGGWIANSGLRRRRVRMFTEGSEFARPLSGRVVDVTPHVPDNSPPHRVFRDGRGFFVGMGKRP
jgi:CRISPR-associated protein Csm4